MPFSAALCLSVAALAALALLVLWVLAVRCDASEDMAKAVVGLTIVAFLFVIAPCLIYCVARVHEVENVRLYRD